jgi:hypothetical protein
MAEHGSGSDPDDDDDVNDDELEQLARINAEFNSNNLPEKSVESKGISQLIFYYLSSHYLFRYTTYISTNTS